MPELFAAARQKIKNLLQSIYGNKLDENFLEEFYQLIAKNIKDTTCSLSKWDQNDTILITYGDSVIKEGDRPLQTLHHFLKDYLQDETDIIHILPFFPYSSDDGFSVIDYYQVNPELGDWDDISQINADFDLMMDLVINHISKKSQWFQNYLNGKNPGKNYFIEMDPHTDISSVTRPRSTDLLTVFHTPEGKKYVWTTFSEDQIDLDFSNPRVLYEMFRVLFFYIHKGARIIRLDAIAYLWKKTGTSCIHLPETHKIVRLIRELAELIDPNVIILTETNVPHKENLSYFGSNYNEAHVIYQFSLPPLLLYTLHKGNSKHLSDWVATIPETEGNATYLNFTASHDGIGVRPLEGILPEDEKKALLDKMKEFGGYISTKTNPDTSESPYEINITYFDALKGTSEGIDSLQMERFLCSQTIMLALKGIPAFYIHSLLATENYHEGVKETGKYRTINRKKLDYQEITREINNNNSPKKKMFSELKRLIHIRKNQPAFHPDSLQRMLKLGNEFFAVERTHENGQNIFSISNITDQSQALSLNAFKTRRTCKDLISGETLNREKADFKPYQTRWLMFF